MFGKKKDKQPLEKREKLSWKERFMVKRIIKHGFRGIKETRKLKKEQKNAEALETQRQRTITAIMNMGEVFDLFQDEECKIPATEEWFQKQDIDFLLDYLEDILELTKVRIDEK